MRKLQARLPRRFARLWRRVVETSEREGGVALARRVVRKATAPVASVSSLRFFVRELGEPLPHRPDTPAFTVRDVSPADLVTFRDGFDPSQSEVSLRERLRRGHRCLLILGPEARPVHTRWYCTSSAHVPEINRDLVLARGEAYFYNGYTPPAVRGLGFDGLARCLLFDRLRAAGSRRVYSYVRGDNPTGMRAARRWQEPAFRIRYLRIGGAIAFVGRAPAGARPALLEPLDASSGEGTDERQRAWRDWFESWTRKPLTMRSTGYHHRPEAYFIETAAFATSTLDLDPESDRCLDVGCDSAMVTRLVAPRSQRLVGVDLVPAMLREARAMELRSASGAPADFVAASGDGLPFRSGSFDKTYCCGMIHTLPSRKHGLAVIEELVRVTAPGGSVLVGAVPDRAKRWSAIQEAWDRSTPAEKARLMGSLVLPLPLKRFMKRAGLGPAAERLTMLEYDLDALKHRLELKGLECRVLDFPERYPSRDFRRTRSNLRISIPAGRAMESG